MNIKPVRASLILYSLMFNGCASVPDLTATDRSEEASQLVRDRGSHEMGCGKLNVERPVRRDLAGEWPVLSSEYKVWIRGCGKEARYRVVCHPENSCVLDELTPMPPTK